MSRRRPVALAARLAVVTGASSGIGAATAAALAAEGMHVILIARRHDELMAVADAIRSSGGRADVVAADLSDERQVAVAAADLLERFGAPDVLINNAGSGRFLSIEETSPDEATQMMRVPYFATFLLTRALIEPMLARRSGTILMVNTPASIVPWPGAVGYSAARWAVRGFTQALRADLRGTGIAVSSVTPTRVTSDYFAHNPGARERIPKAEVLVGSMTPEQVAAVIVRTVRRGSGDVHAPWRWAMLEPLARAWPGPIAWLYARTGRRRSADDAGSLG